MITLQNFFLNKRGEEQVLPQIIFVSLNILVFTILIVFVNSSSGGVSVYEPMYAKQIALAIDEASPGMNIRIDLSEGIEIATENEMDRKKIIRVDNDENFVRVKLSKSGSHQFYFFSDYYIEQQLDGNILALEVKENAD